jgi:hypothetical protein
MTAMALAFVAPACGGRTDDPQSFGVLEQLRAWPVLCGWHRAITRRMRHGQTEWHRSTVRVLHGYMHNREYFALANLSWLPRRSASSCGHLVIMVKPAKDRYRHDRGVLAEVLMWTWNRPAGTARGGSRCTAGMTARGRESRRGDGCHARVFSSNAHATTSSKDASHRLRAAS